MSNWDGSWPPPHDATMPEVLNALRGLILFQGEQIKALQKKMAFLEVHEHVYDRNSGSITDPPRKPHKPTGLHTNLTGGGE